MSANQNVFGFEIPEGVVVLWHNDPMLYAASGGAALLETAVLPADDDEWRAIGVDPDGLNGAIKAMTASEFCQQVVKTCGSEIVIALHQDHFAQLTELQQRVVLAHELGHFWCGHLEASASTIVSAEEADRRETEADAFAAAACGVTTEVVGQQVASMLRVAFATLRPEKDAEWVEARLDMLFDNMAEDCPMRYAAWGNFRG